MEKEGEIRMTRALLSFSIVLAMFLQAGCTPGEKLHFSDFRDFESSNAHKNWFQGVVPDSAKDIDVWYELESGLVRASFSYSGEKPIPIEAQPLSDLDLATAKNSYPDIKGQSMKISYSCSSKEIGQGKQTVRYTEVRFWGDSNGRMFYWNTLAGDVFDSICK